LEEVNSNKGKPMKKIRSKFFETNSSSTHAISISKELVVLDFSLHGPNPLLIIETKSFGYEFVKTNQTEEKLSYLFTCIDSLVYDRKSDIKIEKGKPKRNDNTIAQINTKINKLEVRKKRLIKLISSYMNRDIRVRLTCNSFISENTNDCTM